MGPSIAGSNQPGDDRFPSVCVRELLVSNEGLSNLLHEERRFPPSEEFAAQANAKADLYDTAAADRLAFWEEQARALSWDKPWDTVLDWQPPFARWFDGGKLNVAYNCVDRHVEAGLGERVAIHWEGEPGDTRTITYAELQREVCRAANALTDLGVRKGDRVAIYLPMIPEAAVAMLACARLGAPHSVVFGGFSSDALASRITDASPRSSSPPTAATARQPERAQARGRRGGGQDLEHREGAGGPSYGPGRRVGRQP
jgi:acetyl-CoA synthetase